eukprot:287017_1
MNAQAQQDANQPAPQQQQQQQQQQQPPQQRDPRQQVSINAALDTLCSMFESVDRDVVHMILIEGCGGNMENAVEALLTMTGGISQQQQKGNNKPKTKPKQAPSQPQPQQSMMNLPDDFLRPPSYFLSKYENAHEFDKERAEQRQIIEDEMFAKAIFEDSLFAADLHANPEWVLEEINKSKKKSKTKNKNNLKNKGFSWRGHDDDEAQIDLNNVDPSDVNARKISFKQRFNTLGNTAKQKLGILAHKLQRNKQESKHKNRDSHQYRNVLKSLDDEALIDDDDDGNNAIIEVASEDNRGTYQAPIVPSKPTQQL